MPPKQWCQSLLSIGEDNLQFYPNFALFSTLGGMNLDHDFAQVWKFSRKKRSSSKIEHFFFPNSGEDQKKRSSSKIEHFFPQIFALMHYPFKILGGMQMWTILKLLGGIYPPSPRVSAPLLPCVSEISF